MPAPPPPTLTFPLPTTREPALRDQLTTFRFAFSEAPHAFWRVKGEGCVGTFYRSGKLVLQGVTAPTVARLLGLATDDEAAPAAQGGRFAAALARHPSPPPEAWIGSDEVGKGDYFGPLVVVAVRVERRDVALLEELGVADSKTLGDRRMLGMADELALVVKSRAVVVGPEAYNRLYAEMRNLNHLLAWAHARAIEDLLGEAPAPYALVDQFADARVLQRRLLGAGRQIRVDQRPGGEADPAVAAASILARAEFLRGMERLSRSAGFTLPRGAGPPVLAGGRRLVAELGPSALGRFVKLHFKTTGQVMGR
jgi:ribonuclease HIII